VSIIGLFSFFSLDEIRWEDILSPFLALPVIPVNATWSPNGVPIVTGLERPHGLVFDDNQTILVAAFGNQSIMQYNTNGSAGRVVAGGKGNGSLLNQLSLPINLAVDRENDSLVICDHGNRRVVRWSRLNTTQQGDILLNNISCYGLALDDQRNLYVSDVGKHEVRRYQLGDTIGTLVAGGNGNGSSVNQLHNPYYIFVDREQSVYVSDNGNHRVVKWSKHAVEGIIIAGQGGKGNSLAQLSHPDGIFVDNDGTLYVVENDNHRMTRWHHEALVGVVVVGGKGIGQGANQLNFPFGLCFDQQGNLYIADDWNRRVQRFSIQ
jgi:sugar lactone lactonase YvrE